MPVYEDRIRADRPFGSLLVGVDATLSGDRVLDLAVALASERRLPVHLATVRSPGLSPEVDAAEAGTRAEVLRDAGIEVTVHLLESNDPADALTTLAATLPAPLLCFATHARTALGAVFLGSVTIDVEALWRGPVLLVGPRVVPETSTPTRLVICVDDETDVGPLAALAGSWRSTFGGNVEVFEAVAPGTVGSTANSGEPVTTELKRAIAEIDGATVRWAADRDPARAVLAATDEPGTVIAVHSHVRRGLARVARGSVAGEVLHSSTVPVLILPRAGDEG
jgi:nucleotide-binding universal stress UspA family protein